MKGPRPKKVAVVAELREALGHSKGVLLTNYRGLTVAEITSLRRKLREVGAEYHVTKNTLLVRAFGEVPPGLEAYLQGPTAIAVCRNDPVPAAKVLLDSFRDLRKPDVTVKAGYVDGRVLDGDQVVALSKLPPRTVILGQAVGTIQAPLSNFVGTLSGVLSEFVRTLQAQVDKLQGQPAA